MTTCSFDYMTEDEDTKVFVGAIFFWSYLTPMLLIVYFYSQLIKSVRVHEKMLREQVSFNFPILEGKKSNPNVDSSLLTYNIPIIHLVPQLRINVAEA